jgi:cell division protein FtsA
MHKLVRTRLEARGVRLDSLHAGVHLTGGWSLLPGICELAGEVFGIPAPRARVKCISSVVSVLENPRRSCALGLVKLAAGIEG